MFSPTSKFVFYIWITLAMHKVRESPVNLEGTETITLQAFRMSFLSITLPRAIHSVFCGLNVYASQKISAYLAHSYTYRAFLDLYNELVLRQSYFVVSFPPHFWRIADDNSYSTICLRLVFRISMIKQDDCSKLWQPLLWKISNNTTVTSAHPQH